MPPFPGEDRLVTVFADVHYYFAPPTIRPALHRFDKSSYFYIYYNSTRHTSRIEVANNPGTPEQDAFNGYIDTCRIINSYRFPTRMTIIVDDVDPTSPTVPRTGRDPDEWRLASADPRDPGRSKLRLHTLDAYFWAQDDAKLVVECLKKLCHPTQLDLEEMDPEPEPGHEAEYDQYGQRQGSTVSPVVQNLEHMAIHDQSYGQATQDRSPQSAGPSAGSSIPPPPAAFPSRYSAAHSPSPAISDLSSPQSKHSSEQQPQQSFAPLAYNPAAPAAPEKIAHREKTPPPEDGDQGTGLNHAARHDVQPPPGYNPGLGGQHSGYAAPPPQFGVGFGSPPPQSGVGYGSPPPPSAVSSGAPSFGPGAVSTIGPPIAQERHSSAAEHYVPQQTLQEGPVVTPGSQFLNSLPQAGGKPLAHVQPRYPDYLSAGGSVDSSAGQALPGQETPVGGFSSYSYSQPTQAQTNPYDIHNQIYRPTAAEHDPHKHRKSSSKPDKKHAAFDTMAAKADKGVSKFMKKIEKRLG